MIRTSHLPRAKWLSNPCNGRAQHPRHGIRTADARPPDLLNDASAMAAAAAAAAIARQREHDRLHRVTFNGD